MHNKNNKINNIDKIDKIKNAKSLEKLKINVAYLLLLIPALYFYPKISFSIIFAVSIHELGHLLAAKLCKIEIKQFRLHLLGASIIPKSTLFSYKQELILCLGGPLANFISAFFMVAFRCSPEIFDLFFLYSISLGTLNLLPINNFDGGRILLALLLCKFSPKTTEKVCATISFVLIFSLWTVSVYLLLKTSFSISLFIFSISLFTKKFIRNPVQ